MSYTPGQPVTAVVQRVEIHKLRQGENLILGFSIGGGIDQDPSQNPFSEDKTDKGIYVTRVSEGGPAEIAGLQIGDKIMQAPTPFIPLMGAGLPTSFKTDISRQLSGLPFFSAPVGLAFVFFKSQLWYKSFYLTV
ncbi:Tax1 (human T-cell leukemia virus type I) binding protein 3, isoform CRA_a [Mus musculus]|nr:Tax1 (human T-cell leukemia virus type I) binding protein 3, isoform CRA_a [Mus musculus]